MAKLTKIKSNIIINVSHFQHSLFFEELMGFSSEFMAHLKITTVFGDHGTTSKESGQTKCQNIDQKLRGPGMQVKTFQMSCLTMFARWFQHATCLTTPKT